MRTRGHTPRRSSGRAGSRQGREQRRVWVALGVVLGVVDSSNREAWLICAALGPVAIGLNYGIKLIVKRPRPVLEGLPPLGGAPSSLSFPSAHATSSFAVATAMTRVDAARAPLAFVLALALSLGRPYLGHALPLRRRSPAPSSASLLGLIVPLSL